MSITGGIMFRRAELGDVEVLSQLLYELYKDQDISVTHEAILEDCTTFINSDAQIFFLAFDGEAPVGACHGALRHEYVNGKEYEGTCGYLEAVYVRPTHRLRGIAAKFVALCENWARENDCREFLSDCLLHNTESLKFHLRLGFVETERCIFFRKELGKKPISDRF